MRFIVLPSILLLTGIIAGCSSGAGPPPAITKSTVPVHFSIVVPARTKSSHEHPLYVSSATMSAIVTVTPAGGVAAAPTSVSCTSVCSGSLLAPIGSDTFSISLYDGTNGAGALLSTGATTATVFAGHDNNINVTFDPVVKSFAILAPTFIPQGPSGSGAYTVSVKALDAAGETIIGPGAFVDTTGSPLTIALTTTDAPAGVAGGSSLSQTTLTGPASVEFNYSGGPISSTTISATTSQPIPGPITPATIDYVSLTLLPGSLTFVSAGEAQTVTASEANYLGSFTTTNSNPAVATISPATSSGAFTVTAVADGTTSIGFTDANGATATLPVLVHIGVGHLYVANVQAVLNQGYLDVFGLNDSNKPQRTIAASASLPLNPGGIAVGGDGTIYVANTAPVFQDQHPQILVFAPNAPPRSIALEVPVPGSKNDHINGVGPLALASDGTLEAIGDDVIGNFYLLTILPSGSISATPFGLCFCIATDRAGDIFVGTQNQIVNLAGTKAYAVNDTTARTEHIAADSNNNVYGIFLSPQNGYSLAVFPAGGGMPRIVSGSNTGMNDTGGYHAIVSGVAADSRGNAYVSTLFHNNGGAFYGTIALFPATAQGNTTPTLLYGPGLGLYPSGIAIGP